MPDIQHVILQNADVHEPKHITDSLIGDAGKVITPAGGGTSQLRFLAQSEIEDVNDAITVELADISTASSAWIVAPFNGTITQFYSVIDGAIALANATITPFINGIPITGGTITIAFAGSAAGDVDSATPIGNNIITAGQAIEFQTNGASTNTVKAQFTAIIERNP